MDKQNLLLLRIFKSKLVGVEWEILTIMGDYKQFTYDDDKHGKFIWGTIVESKKRL